MSLSRNAAYTLSSATLQIVVTLITIPVYLSVIGLERYGVLVIVWLVYEYLMLLNLGLDRATIRFISQRRGIGARSDSLFWTAVTVAAGMGVVGSVLVYTLLPHLLVRWLSVDAKLLAEVHLGFFALALLVVVGTVGTIVASLLQAQDRFVELNASQLAMGVAFQVVPVVAAATISPTLEILLLAGCAARSVQTWMYIAFAFVRKHRVGRPTISLQDAREMLRYGAWTSVSGVISPVVVNLDRMLISSLSGSAAVGTYSVAYNLVMKGLLIPGSLAAALFPKLSQSAEPLELARRANTAAFSLGILFCPMLIIGCAALEPFLSLWLHRFASHEAVVSGEVLLFGIWFNGLALVALVHLQAAGRPDLVAKIHAVELLPFVAILWLAVRQFGIVGAAAAWTLRVAVDAIALFHIAGMLTVLTRRLLVPGFMVAGMAILFSLVRATLPLSMALGFAGIAVWALWAQRALPDDLRRRLGWRANRSEDLLQPRDHPDMPRFPTELP